MFPDSRDVIGLIQLALREDLVDGDITTSLTVAEGLNATATLLTREELCVCGLPIIALIAKEHGCALEVEMKAKDGEIVGPDTVIALLSGKLHILLELERTILNFVQHLSGVATTTHKTIQKRTTLKLLDTRKTTPGFRELEKYAVRIGGANNHRKHLGDMILIKNNHIDAHGGDIRATLSHIRESKPEGMRWEVEVRDLTELAVALEFRPDMIMLDNMDDQRVKEAMKLIRDADTGAFIEVSGNVTPERFSSLEEIGVDGVSMGALTYGARSVDISLRIQKDTVRGA